MDTKIYKIDGNRLAGDSLAENRLMEDELEEAAQIIREGGLVAFPTETVYGLGADALRPEAAKKIYAAKGRPSDNPLIVHIARLTDLYCIAEEVPKDAGRLAEAFWPGPLTVIVKKNGKVPRETTGGLDTVAVRMPSHPVARELIRRSGCLIAAPSANISGRPSPTLAQHVAEDLSGKIPLILDGGEVGIGLESTIVDLTEDVPMILRPGAVTREMLEQVIGRVKLDPGAGARPDPGAISQDSPQRPKAPGMKYRHYAPKAELALVTGEMENVVAKINALTAKRQAKGEKVGIIGTEETASLYQGGLVLSAGTRGDGDEIARRLYRILREFDEAEVDVIYSESFSDAGIGQAVMNRLEKAAGHRVIFA